jgi:hypothetical protein
MSANSHPIGIPFCQSALPWPKRQGKVRDVYDLGDELLIVSTSTTREATERRLRAVSRRGKLAYWFDEFGEPD